MCVWWNDSRVNCECMRLLSTMNVGFCVFYLVKILHRQASMRPALWLVVSPVLMHVLQVQKTAWYRILLRANFKYEKLTNASVRDTIKMAFFLKTKCTQKWEIELALMTIRFVWLSFFCETLKLSQSSFL